MACSARSHAAARLFSVLIFSVTALLTTMKQGRMLRAPYFCTQQECFGDLYTHATFDLHFFLHSSFSVLLFFTFVSLERLSIKHSCSKIVSSAADGVTNDLSLVDTLHAKTARYWVSAARSPSLRFSDIIVTTFSLKSFNFVRKKVALLGELNTLDASNEFNLQFSKAETVISTLKTDKYATLTVCKSQIGRGLSPQTVLLLVSLFEDVLHLAQNMSV